MIERKKEEISKIEIEREIDRERERKGIKEDR